MSMALRLCVMFFLLAYPLLARADHYKLAASSVDSAYHAAGVALEAVTSLYLTPATGIKLTSVSTGGVGGNIEQLSKGEVDFAIVPSLVGFHARTGTGSVAALGPQEDLRAVAVLVPTYVHALLRKSAVRSGHIDDLFALPAETLLIGSEASEAEDAGRFLFQQLGVSQGAFDDLMTDSLDPVSAFLGGEIDALLTTGSLPIAAVEELLEKSRDDIAILGASEDQLRQISNGVNLLVPATLPPHTYPGQAKAIQTLALPVFLATRADVDEEVVYQIAKNMFEQVGFLRAIHPAMAGLDFETAIDDLPVPLHPGAARYFRDYGLTLADTTTAVPDYPVYTLDAEDSEQRRIDTNKGVVGIMVDPDPTALQAASELAVMVNSAPGDVRVVVQRGEGAAMTVNDLLYMKGVDLGIVTADVLEHLRAQDEADWLPDQLQYLAKLGDNEVHLLAGGDIRKIQDLAGKTVNFGPPGSASEVTAATIFSHLGIAVRRASDPPELALEKLRLGEIDAVLLSGVKPMSSLTSIKPSSGLKLLDIPYISHRGLYRQSLISGEDYPNLVEAGQALRTLSVPAMLMTYKWPENSKRYKLLSAFFGTFKERLEQLQAMGHFHPSWQAVSLTADLAGWTRSSIAAAPLATSAEEVAADDDGLALPTPPALPLPAQGEAEGPVLTLEPANIGPS